MSDEIKVENEKETQGQVAKSTVVSQPASNFIEIGFVFSIAVFVGIILLFVYNKYQSYGGGKELPSNSVEQIQTINNIVYVDLGMIISAATDKYIVQSKKDGSDPKVNGEKFSDQLASVFNEYRDNGILVFDSRYIVASPQGHDITEIIAKKLDLELKKK